MPELFHHVLRCGVLAGALLASVHARADDAAAPGQPDTQRVRWLSELDPYYSSLALEIPIGDTSPGDGDQLPETWVYRQLWRQSLRPQIVLLEASVYPMPIFGTWLKSHHPDSYRQFDLGSADGNTLNLMDAVTAGFQEPWALSVFVGSAMNFQALNDVSPNNRAYMGYLLSYGAQHIWQNQLIQDRWWELEWKLKGERRYQGDELSWSFRLGLKEHGHPDIADVLFVALRRSSLNFNASLFDWLKNSNMEWKTEFDRRNADFLRQELSLGYKLPYKPWGMALGLDLGLIFENGNKYRGSLSDPDADRYTIMLRPRLEF